MGHFTMSHSARATSSQRLWGKEVPTEEKAARLLEQFKSNFPDCVSAAEASLACAREHHSCASDPCQAINDQLHFCMVFDYCPEEATEFAHCVQKYNKPVQLDKYPRGCRKQFGNLDRCMISHQKPE